VATSQNYYLADHSAALAAEHFADTSTAKMLRARAKQWPKLFDPSVGGGFFRPKTDQDGWFGQFSEYQWRGAYTESGPWQYRFYVPHDPQGLRAAYEKASGNRSPSSASHMCDRLLDMMTGPNTITSRGPKIHEQIEMQNHCFGQYAHNNQPSHHILYMFAHAGCPFDGQKWIHHTLTKLYTANGFAGDEDNGEMASWYTLSSIGLYALVPGSGEYQIGAPPLFKQVTIHREGARGGPLVIKRDFKLANLMNPLKKFSPAKSATWNGRSIDLATGAATVPYSELLAGGQLVFHG
jgi:putative alpha-1,2-mannosidase